MAVKNISDLKRFQNKLISKICPDTIIMYRHIFTFTNKKLNSKVILITSDNTNFGIKKLKDLISKFGNLKLAGIYKNKEIIGELSINSENELELIINNTIINEKDIDISEKIVTLR